MDRLSIVEWPSDELDPRRGKETHLQEHPPMSPPLDVRGSVGTLPITYGQFHDFESELRCAEQEIEVAERIEVAEVRPVRRDRLIRFSAKHFRAKKRVLDWLSKHPTECEAEELFPDKVRKPHRLLFHRIHQ